MRLKWITSLILLTTGLQSCGQNIDGTLTGTYWNPDSSLYVEVYKEDLKSFRNINNPVLHSIEGGRLVLMLELDGELTPVYGHNHEVLTFHHLAEARDFIKPLKLSDVKLEQQQFFVTD